MSSSVFRNLLHLRKSDVMERVAQLTKQILVIRNRGIVSNDKIAELISFQKKKLMISQGILAIFITALDEKAL